MNGVILCYRRSARDRRRQLALWTATALVLVPVITNIKHRQLPPGVWIPLLAVGVFLFAITLWWEKKNWTTGSLPADWGPVLYEAGITNVYFGLSLFKAGQTLMIPPSLESLNPAQLRKLLAELPEPQNLNILVFFAGWILGGLLLPGPFVVTEIVTSPYFEDVLGYLGSLLGVAIAHAVYFWFRADRIRHLDVSH